MLTEEVEGGEGGAEIVIIGQAEWEKINAIELLKCTRMLYVFHFLILHCSSASKQVDVDCYESQWCLIIASVTVVVVW